MGWNNTVFPLLIITPTGGFTGLFVYSPGPGSGQLIASITSAAGTDPYGNAFQKGITTYGPGGSFAQLLSTVLSFLSPGNVTAAGVQGGNGNLTISSGAVAATNTIPQITLTQSADLTHAPVVQLASNASLGTFLTWLQATVAPSAPAVPGLIWLPSRTHLSELDAQGQEYLLGHATTFSTGDQLVNSTTFATVCGTAPAVGIGTYRVHAEITAVQGPNANPNDYRLGFTGTISQVRMKMVSGQDATNMFLASTTSNNGLLPTHGWAAGSTYTATFHGIIVTTSTGTLSIQAAMDAAGDTFTVLALSDFHLEPVN